MALKKTFKPISFWHSPTKGVPKKELSWSQAKARYPKLSPIKDSDKDKIPNWLDCKPFNRKKQGIYHLPMTQVGYRRERRRSFPKVVRYNKGHVVDVIGRRGVKTYYKTYEEKLEDIKKEVPYVTVQSQIDMEQGSARGIIAKGRTPGKVIFRQVGTKKREENYDYGPAKKVNQISIVNKKTGDIEQYQEARGYTKKELEKELDEKYNPYSQVEYLNESTRDMEMLTKTRLEDIQEKRSALRREARDSSLQDDYPEEKTEEALREVTTALPDESKDPYFVGEEEGLKKSDVDFLEEHKRSRRIGGED